MADDAFEQRPETIEMADPTTGAAISLPVWERNTAQFAARLRKVAKERRKWARKNGILCYRVYDADLPDYAFAIDIYEGAGPCEGKRYVVIAEYRAPSDVDEVRAAHRFADAMAVVPLMLSVPEDRVFPRQRRRDKGGSQYKSTGRKSYRATTSESGYLMELDFGGQLDTGLFLDHRETRKMIGSMASGTRFLNLFAYTGAATVHAAGGGAKSTVTVDMSGNYLEWAKRNMHANGFTGPEHGYIHADATKWVHEEAERRHTYDLIFVDPPTFSNSKSMDERTWDVQRDHVAFLGEVGKLLTPKGRIVFSCNLRNFVLDEDSLAEQGLAAQDITAQTIPHDFERNPRIHRCFIVTRR